jgi:hypothetical protein
LFYEKTGDEKSRDTVPLSEWCKNPMPIN